MKERIEELPKQRIIVEIGVGENPGVTEFSPAGILPKAGDKYYAVELDRTNAYGANKILKAMREGSEYQSVVVRADAGSLPFPDGSVDELVLTNILNADLRTGEAEKIMKEALKAIKKDGKIVVMESVGDINDEYETLLAELMSDESLEVAKSDLPGWKGASYEIRKV